MSARRSGAGARRVNGADHRSVDPAASRLTDALSAALLALAATLTWAALAWTRKTTRTLGRRIIV